MSFCYAWVLNLDAELELANPSYNPSDKLTRQQAACVSEAESLIGPQGTLLDHLQPQQRSSYLGRAWCPTARALAAMRAAHVRPEPHPPVATLRRVNHRAFAHELGRGLPYQALVRDEESLYAVLRDTTRPWLLKRPLAFAGRGQQRILGAIEKNTRNWISASLRADALIVEPLVFLLAEFSLHGFLWPNGQRQWGRPCVQSVSERGVFRGVRLAQDNDLSIAERNAMEEAGDATAAALYQAGYFGPFGIDAYRYRMPENPMREAFCAVSEINARYTMGFITGFPTHPSALHLAPGPPH